MTVADPAWWSSAQVDGRPMPEVLAARDFGAVFRFLNSRGWSIGSISAATGLDEYPVREIIKGRRRITAYDVIERVVVGLGIDRHLCGIGTASVSTEGLDGNERHGMAELEEWLARSGAVDAATVTTLAQQTNYLRRIDRTLGANAADHQLRGHLKTLRSLRSFSLSPRVREQLADLFCDAAALAGWVALDLGDVAAAWRLHEAAKDAGRETGSVIALTHALAQQAYVLLDIGRVNQARSLAEQALSVAGTRVPAVLLAWLRAVVGEVAAVAGDVANTHGYFDQATHALPADLADPSIPYIMLDEYHLARWHGTAAARLGEESAISQLHYALTGMDGSFVRARAQLHIELAHSLIAAKQVDQAVRQAAQAKELAIRVGSARQRRRVRDLELLLSVPR